MRTQESTNEDFGVTLRFPPNLLISRWRTAPGNLLLLQMGLCINLFTRPQLSLIFSMNKLKLLVRADLLPKFDFILSSLLTVLAAAYISAKCIYPFPLFAHFENITSKFIYRLGYQFIQYQAHARFENDQFNQSSSSPFFYFIKTHHPCITRLDHIPSQPVSLSHTFTPLKLAIAL